MAPSLGLTPPVPLTLAASVTGIPERTLRRMCSAGDLAAVRVGHRWRIVASELERLVAANAEAVATAIEIARRARAEHTATVIARRVAATAATAATTDTPSSRRRSRAAYVK